MPAPKDPTLAEVAARHHAHNNAVVRAQKGLSAPPGKKCIEEGCTNGAFPWQERCRKHEKQHRRALREANKKPIVPCCPYAFEWLFLNGCSS